MGALYSWKPLLLFLEYTSGQFRAKERFTPVRADTRAIFCHVSNLLLLGFERPSISLRTFTARGMIAAVLLTVPSFELSGHCVETKQPEFKKLFHLVGIPGLRRNQRVDLTTNSEGLVFETNQTHYEVPYARLRQVLLLRADRRYEGRTYAAALATYGVGALLILKKHHVDTVILDYVNEREGKMGIVVQMETSQGERFREVLKQRDVAITEPDQVSDSAGKEKLEGNTVEGDKP